MIHERSWRDRSSSNFQLQNIVLAWISLLWDCYPFSVYPISLVVPFRAIFRFNPPKYANCREA